MSSQDNDYPSQAKIIESPEYIPGSFDLRVTVKNAKTGEVIKHQPYNLHCDGKDKYFERPIGSGNLFYGSGQPAGRWMRNPDWKKGSSVPEYYANTEAEHVEFEVTQARQLTVEAMQAAEADNASLRAELAALKAEKEGKSEANLSMKDKYEQGKLSKQ